MNSQRYALHAAKYLNSLCGVKPNRRTGSAGNRRATTYAASLFSKWGYAVDATPFSCLDFESNGAELSGGGRTYKIFPSPYSLGCSLSAELVTASTIKELQQCACTGKILLLSGTICATQLMPKNFVFYNPESHKKIYALLEEKMPAAIITATGKNPDLVGGAYPFPMIEDGDFHIPTAFCTDITGKSISARAGQPFKLTLRTQRIQSTASNVIAVKNARARSKIVICAHIDAYGEGPGASDNASGVTILLLLAHMLKDYKGKTGIEIVAFNGEDNYSVGGQMDYLRRYGDSLRKIRVAINLDDIGYIKGRTAVSLYSCPMEIAALADKAFSRNSGLVNGEQWYQGDHMIFVQKNVPAIAFTSEKMKHLMATITHTLKDKPEIVDCEKLVGVAAALNMFIQDMQNLR